MIEDHGFVRTEPPKSPLDPFLCQFLGSIEAMNNGYLPSSDRHAVAMALGWPLDFADAIMTSAQARGMVERVLIGHGRRRSLWQISARGRTWLEMTTVLGSVSLDSEPDLSPTHAAML
ncbi:MAG: hypothetical protein M3464_11450 [Chloroflexota bacterium]|nr:hypothetical protein [Chloroflexota bacterium]